MKNKPKWLKNGAPCLFTLPHRGAVGYTVGIPSIILGVNGQKVRLATMNLWGAFVEPKWANSVSLRSLQPWKP